MVRHSSATPRGRQPSARELVLLMGRAVSDKRRLVSFIRMYHGTPQLPDAIKVVREYLKLNAALFPFLGPSVISTASENEEEIHSIYLSKIGGTWIGIALSRHPDVEPLYIRCGPMALPEALVHIGAVIDLK